MQHTYMAVQPTAHSFTNRMDMFDIWACRRNVEKGVGAAACARPHAQCRTPCKLHCSLFHKQVCVVCCCHVATGDLQQYVQLYKTPPDPVFYDVIYHSCGIVPALANPAYYSCKLTSAVITTLMTGVLHTVCCVALPLQGLGASLRHLLQHDGTDCTGALTLD